MYDDALVIFVIYVWRVITEMFELKYETRQIFAGRAQLFVIMDPPGVLVNKDDQDSDKNAYSSMWLFLPHQLRHN